MLVLNVLRIGKWDCAVLLLVLLVLNMACYRQQASTILLVLLVLNLLVLNYTPSYPLYRVLLVLLVLNVHHYKSGIRRYNS